MKINEVKQRVVKGKRIGGKRLQTYELAFASYGRYSDEWPVDTGMVNEWLASMPKEYSDETVEMSW